MATRKDHQEAGGTRAESLGRFLGELRRRRVWKTAFAYAAAVFVLLQLGEIVFPAFGLPELALRILVVACFLGFPLALALAWAFDITPKGILRADAEPGETGREEYSGSLLPRFALLAVTVATVGGIGWWALQDTLAAQPEGGAPGADPVATLAGTGEAPLAVRSLAVLPLDDFSEEESENYFTAGLHEELIFQLSQIGAARVLSRTTVVQYDREGKTMPVIADELGVDGVVEGTVFRDGERVKITVQLIHGPTDQHLWSNSYEGTLEDAIALQSEVAAAIAREIRAELFPMDSSAERVGRRVAASRQVQEEYLKGRYEQSRSSPEALTSALSHYQTAVALDSTFAPAYAGLAAVRLLLRAQTSDSLGSAVMVDEGVSRALQRALHWDSRSPEARAVWAALRGTPEIVSDSALPSITVLAQDSSALLEGELALAGSEFGRQLQRVVLAHPQPHGDRVSPAERLAAARRLQTLGEHEEAETLVRDVIRDAPDRADAWEQLEELKALQGDFQGVVEILQERLAKDPPVKDELAELQDLERRVSEEGEAGYWRWRAEDLQARKSQGESVSSVELARAVLALGEPDEALRYLEEAARERDRALVSLWTDPAWDALRTNDRFRKILSEVRENRTRGQGLPRQQERFR